MDSRTYLGLPSDSSGVVGVPEGFKPALIHRLAHTGQGVRILAHHEGEAESPGRIENPHHSRPATGTCSTWPRVDQRRYRGPEAAGRTKETWKVPNAMTFTSASTKFFPPCHPKRYVTAVRSFGGRTGTRRVRCTLRGGSGMCSILRVRAAKATFGWC